MMYHIRPWKLFDLVPERAAKDRLVTMKIPLRRFPQFADYSLRLLELMSLIACIKIVKPKRIFEIGTFCGNSTLHMMLNAPGAEIFTLDADDETLRAADSVVVSGRPDSALEGQVSLTELYAWRHGGKREYEAFNGAGRVVQLIGNSLTFDFSPWRNSIDLMLIDGDHSYDGVKSDTGNAFKMLSSAGCILWHDYRNPDCSGNTHYLDELASSILDLFHIEDSSLCIYFRDAGIIETLKAFSSK